MIGRKFKTGPLKSSPIVQVVAKRTVMTGDWYISGAFPAAYKANHNLDMVAYVALPVDDANNLNKKIEAEIEIELSDFIYQLSGFDPSINKNHVLHALDSLKKNIEKL